MENQENKDLSSNQENSAPSHESHTPEEYAAAKHGGEKDHSHESLFGALLLLGMILLLLLFVAGASWFAYAKWWKVSKEADARPSITTLSAAEKERAEQAKVADEKAEALAEEKKSAETKEADPAVLTAAQASVLSVLNGGAAKGSAGTLVEALKKEGFTKSVVGNATGDHTGAVIYHKAGLEKEAEVVKTSVAKTYPKVEVKVAVTTNKETSVAPITVILGK